MSSIKAVIPSQIPSRLHLRCSSLSVGRSCSVSLESSKVSRCVSWERIMFCGLLTGCQQTWNWQSGRVQPHFKWTDRKTNKINYSKYVRVKIYFWSYTSLSHDEAWSTLRSSNIGALVGSYLHHWHAAKEKNVHTHTVHTCTLHHSLPKASTQVSGIKNTMVWINTND